MRNKEEFIHEECYYTCKDFKKIKNKLRNEARMYEVDKFNLHIL